jgi:hypothetical protein
MKIITSLKDFFDKGRVKTIFDHLRNLFYCALIIAAGSYVHANPPEWALRISAREVFGYPIIAIGVLLMLLNLADGIYKLSKLEHPVLLSILITLFSLVLAVRLVEIMIIFRMR